MNSSSQIKKFILDNLTSHQKDIIYAAVQRFGVSRQAVLKHMHALIADKQVIAHGKTRDRFYELRPQVNFNKTFAINDDFSTEELIKKSIVPHLRSIPDNIREIILFSMAAILNNCVTSDVIYESLASIKRAGSDSILTYFTPYLLKNNLLMHC